MSFPILYEGFAARYVTGGIIPVFEGPRIPQIGWCLSAAEEAGPEAAVLHGVEFGFQADPVFGEGRFFLCEAYLFLEEAFALGLEFRLVFFQGGDRFFLQFALELDQVQAFYLRPEAVYLHPRGIALLTDLLYLAGPLFEAGLVVLALLQEALVALEGNGGEPGIARRLLAYHLAIEDLLLRGFGAELASEPENVLQPESVNPVLLAFGAEPSLLGEAPDRLGLDIEDGRRAVQTDDLLAPVHERILL